MFHYNPIVIIIIMIIIFFIITIIFIISGNVVNKILNTRSLNMICWHYTRMLFYVRIWVCLCMYVRTYLYMLCQLFRFRLFKKQVSLYITFLLNTPWIPTDPNISVSNRCEEIKQFKNILWHQWIKMYSNPFHFSIMIKYTYLHINMCCYI